MSKPGARPSAIKRDLGPILLKPPHTQYAHQAKAPSLAQRCGKLLSQATSTKYSAASLAFGPLTPAHGMRSFPPIVSGKPLWAKAHHGAAPSWHSLPQEISERPPPPLSISLDLHSLQSSVQKLHTYNFQKGKNLRNWLVRL